jgi:hypothetical protein
VSICGVIERRHGVADNTEIEQAARRLFERAGGDPQKLATVAAQFMLAAKERAKGGVLEVVGGVSFHTGKPFVQLNWGAEVGQLDVEAARSHAQLVLEACQNAVTDAALYAWATEKLELDGSRAAQMIDALRTYRDDHWGETEFSEPVPQTDGQSRVHGPWEDKPEGSLQ